MAATASATLNVTADVEAVCSASTTPVAFGSVNLSAGGSANATGGLSVTCTNGTSWTASANAGTGSGASVASRRMTHGSDASKFVTYNLYTDAVRTQIWGDGANLITGTGNGSSQAVPIYATITAGQSGASPGSYADSVAITVSY